MSLENGFRDEDIAELEALFAAALDEYREAESEHFRNFRHPFLDWEADTDFFGDL